MNKKTGDELDYDVHNEMLNSYTRFIEDFSPLLDKAEIYHRHICAENLINSNQCNKNKLQVMNEILESLNNMVPVFFKIAKKIDRLEDLYTN